MSENVSGRSSLSRMWSITCPTVQKGGTATKSVCIRRPAVSRGSMLRSAPRGRRRAPGPDHQHAVLLEILADRRRRRSPARRSASADNSRQGAEQRCAPSRRARCARRGVEVLLQRLDQGEALVRLQKLDHDPQGRGSPGTAPARARGRDPPPAAYRRSAAPARRRAAAAVASGRLAISSCMRWTRWARVQRHGLSARARDTNRGECCAAFRTRARATMQAALMLRGYTGRRHNCCIQALDLALLESRAQRAALRWS